ncbi:hypothetical protein A3709_18800 [Halioglobus sp. HI00S01]|uniref:hypothetical protein n=1 Tax=Halioglobus sp. HI00S01 TaxID=1822214 RepID=UPI0007C31DC8|nr:hypothetical protein [Halioglobus sp. HI00S01]KZX57674.1 hypothetical protein A3709_18800 [Halioglobus sp. HI00S01]
MNDTDLTADSLATRLVDGLPKEAWLLPVKSFRTKYGMIADEELVASVDGLSEHDMELMVDVHARMETDMQHRLVHFLLLQESEREERCPF